MIISALLVAALVAQAAAPQAAAPLEMMTYQMVLLKKGPGAASATPDQRQKMGLERLSVDDAQGNPQVGSRSNSYLGSVRFFAPGIGAATSPAWRAPSRS